ncbi:MAG: N-acetylmuramoyl-L-alanine amidase [Rhodothermales bacterium]|nr:N-acetylmuramoyl-L-alanine amidase [Rhodothermales bacterium]
MPTRVRMKLERPATREDRNEILRGVYEENLRIVRNEQRPRTRIVRFVRAPATRWTGRVALAALALLVIFGGVQLVREIQAPEARAAGTEEDAAARIAREFDAGAAAQAASASIAGVFDLEVRTIVLDPGHGGYDPGTTGRAGTREKDITLDVARRLRRRLDAYGAFDVLMTREDDRKVHLRERVAFAREQRADLFVSIHVNALPDTAVTSVETYYFGLTEDERTLRSAARENVGSELSNAEFRDALDRAGETMKFQESKQLATSIQSTLFRSIRQVNADARDWGAKSGPFVVLLGVEVPSVLAEIAVLSNPTEESRLNDPAHRERLAGALEAGILAYLRGPLSESMESATHYGSQEEKDDD